MRQIGDRVNATVEMEFYVPEYHVVKAGDPGIIENVNEDVKAFRPGDDLHPCPYLVKFAGASGKFWVGEDEIRGRDERHATVMTEDVWYNGQ